MKINHTISMDVFISEIIKEESTRLGVKFSHFANKILGQALMERIVSKKKLNEKERSFLRWKLEINHEDQRNVFACKNKRLGGN